MVVVVVVVVVVVIVVVIGVIRKYTEICYTSEAYLFYKVHEQS